jgi:hypothetical protein
MHLTTDYLCAYAFDVKLKPSGFILSTAVPLLNPETFIRRRNVRSLLSLLLLFNKVENMQKTFTKLVIVDFVNLTSLLRL